MTITRSAPERGLVGNSVALLAASQITAVLGYAFWMLCARVFSPAVIGVTNTVISAMTLVAILSVAGFIPMLPCLLPGASVEECGGLCSATFIVTVGVSGILGVAAGLAMPQRLHVAVGTGWLVSLLGSGAVGTALLLVINSALLGVRRAELSLIGSVVASASRLAAVAAVLTLGAFATGHDVSATHTVLVIWVSSLGVASVLSVWLLGRAVPGLRFSPCAVSFSRLRRSAGWDHLATLALRSPALSIPILASAHLPPTQVGYLVVAALIASAFTAVPGAVSNALLATCADDPARLREQARRALLLIGVLLIAPVVITSLLSNQVLGFFGPGYADYSLLLVLLLLSTFPDALVNVVLAILRVRRRLKLVAAVTVAGAAITITSTWLLLPHVGIFGAAVAVLGSQLIVAAMLTTLVVRDRSLIAQPGTG